MPRIARCYGVAALKRADTDQEIIEWNRKTLGRRLRADPAHEFSGGFSDRINRDGHFEFVQKNPPPFPSCGRVRAPDTMRQFSNSDRAQRGLMFADFPGDFSQERWNR